MSKDEKRASISDGKWLLVLQDGSLWAPPEGASLRRYDSKTIEALKGGLRPKDVFALSVVQLEDPSKYTKLNVEALHTRMAELAKAQPGPVSDCFLLLDEWLTEQKEAGLPKAWRRDVFRSDALMGVISELVRSYMEAYDVRQDSAPFCEDFLKLLQCLLEGEVPQVEEGSSIEAFLASSWPTDDVRWNLVRILREADA